MERVLFILAGYPGVGKSTLLATALSQRIPLFGTQHDTLFQATRIPPRFPEWTLGARETLEAGSWFSDSHVPYLSKLPELPAHVVLHIDLVWQLTPPPKHRPAALVPLLPRTMQALADPAANQRIFNHILSSDFYRRFDRVLVNTLHAPWRTVARQWHARHTVQKLPPGRVRFFAPVFAYERPGVEIHRAIYRSWIRATAVLAPEIKLFSRVRHGRLTIKQIHA
jgi:hypothetical protein